MKHHAYCYVGIDFARKELSELFENNSPDILIDEWDSFGVNEARDLSVKASLRPAAGSSQTLVVVAHSVTHEAQNALLKLFEEPPLHTQFYFIVPKRGLLLPTLQSRLFFVEADLQDEELSDNEFGIFFAASYADRLKQVESISKKKEIEKIEHIVAGAEQIARDSAHPGLLSTVMLVRSYVGVRGSSAKMLLEALALALPKNQSQNPHHK